MGLHEKLSVKNNSQLIPQLKHEIIRVLSKIKPQLRQNVIDNFYK